MDFVQGNFWLSLWTDFTLNTGHLEVSTGVSLEQHGEISCLSAQSQLGQMFPLSHSIHCLPISHLVTVLVTASQGLCSRNKSSDSKEVARHKQERQTDFGIGWQCYRAHRRTTEHMI